MVTLRNVGAAARRLCRWPALAAVLALAGCASVPDAVRGTSATPQQDLVRVMNAPALYVGQEARFGGKVVKVTNLTGRTRLEIATVPLDSTARPLIHQPSTGRMLAYVNGFLEPSDFNQQWVTVVGPIVGSEKGTIGEANYSFVVIQASGYKRWRLVQQIQAPMGPPLSPWGFGGAYDRGWGPGWGMGVGYGYGDAQVETVIEE